MNDIKILSGIPEMSYGNPSPVCYIGAVMRLLDYLGDPIAQDELISLSGVALCFPWKFNSDCDEVSVIPDIPTRTFAALGYKSEYFTEDQRPAYTDSADRAYSKPSYISKIKSSIDSGRPVVGFGLVTDAYACLITGYYDDGDGLFINSYQKGQTYTSSWYDTCRGILIVGDKTGERLTGLPAYTHIAGWAGFYRAARSKPVTANDITYPLNEAAYTSMCKWLLNDSEWQTLTSHEAYLKQRGLLLVGYYRNNLLQYLKRLDAAHPGVVNPAALSALEDMSKQFPGSHASDLWLNECVDPSVTDFSALRDRAVREKVCRYVSNVSSTDNRIQWSLFMPDAVKRQLANAGVELIYFEYRTLPAFRFVGKELDESVPDTRAEAARVLDAMPEHASGFDYDLLFQHHYGKQVDAERWHGFWGRFMKPGAPAPDGFEYIDFLSPDSPEWSDAPGSPYLRQFAFAVFKGGSDAVLHKSEGFDSDVMYDVTRNTILGEDVLIPYPDNYWTAEVRFDRSDGGEYNPENLCVGGASHSGETAHAGYLFSVDLQGEWWKNPS
ncbi:MAG: hypothetical protein LBS11_10555 [Oscillospiraceae bacterium]|jgi:hypothetical protein|nr:hypothetical protein [Oscillospiraceae bacterium]